MLIDTLRNWLIEQPAIAALIGDRMVLDNLDQDEQLPAADITLVHTSHEHYLQGLAGIANSRVVIDCYAEKRLTAHAVAKAIIESGITRQRGNVGSMQINSIRLTEGPSDAVEEVDPGSDDRRYVSTIVLDVHWNEQCD